jgi:ribosomal protein L7Ae-like RNA K-turn-binding protein
LLAQRLIDLIGLARKAGQAVTGFEKVRARLKQGAAGALVQAGDGAADGKARLARMAAGAPVIEVLNSTELGLAFGRDFAIHAALDRGGFADRVIAEAGRLGGMRQAGPMKDQARRVAVRTSDEKQAGPETVPGQGDR